MPATPFTVDIVTPDRLLTSAEDVVSVVAPAAEGYLGVLAGHAPMAAMLIPGEVRIRHTTGVEETLAVSGGFLEVTQDRVTILADTAEKPDEIDIERAQAAYRRASDRLAHSENVDVDRARLALERAIARLKTAGEPMR